MTNEIVLSDEELAFRNRNLEIYNSGKYHEAWVDACEYYKRNPERLMAQYCYGVMSGDLSDSPSLSETERSRLKIIAKEMTEKLYKHPDFSRFPNRFRYSVANEYFWFHEKPAAQYALGVTRNSELPRSGYYSMCVGAAMMAQKTLPSPVVCRWWASESLDAFREFEKDAPHWHNINHFAAIAALVLERFEHAESIQLDMYRKQKSLVNEKEMDEFCKKREEIRAKVDAFKSSEKLLLGAEVTKIETYDENASFVLNARGLMLRHTKQLETFLEYFALHNCFDVQEWWNLVAHALPRGTATPSSWTHDIGEFPLLDSIDGAKDHFQSALARELRLYENGFTEWVVQKTIPTNDWLRRLIVMYRLYKPLENFMSRSSAIEFAKNMIDYSTIKRASSRADITLEQPESRNAFTRSHDAVRFRFSDGRDGVTMTRCRWAHVLSEIQDPEWAYTVACHYDFVAARCLKPPRTLTRTKTLIQGDYCCDFVWHPESEKREHPNDEFWRQMCAW